MTLIEIKDLRKSFGSVAALDGVDLHVEMGTRTAIVGPSGCGKTTLLRMIAGFDVPDDGSIVFDGGLLADRHVQVPAHKRGIGLVAQDGNLFPHLSVSENIGFGLERHMPGREALILELIDMVGLERSMLIRKPDQLSGGQQQRVALARALARKPRLILLDEPFSALDTSLRVTTRRAVAQVLAAAGITTILVTHDQAEALAFADQVAVMEGGRFAQVGSPREVYSRPIDVKTARFLGEAIVLQATIIDGWAQCALGNIPVGGPTRSGDARIMVRAEQIDVTVRNGHAGANNSVHGTATNIEFNGATSDVSITVGSREPFAMRLRIPNRTILSEGDAVTLTVTGPAHVFPDRDGKPCSDTGVE
ncbi:ABC transporter ATP-binding protein [Agrobacterium sp. SORGH_AS 787]|uniref:ABC transporter ATP-binding protein n=1 Tax=Agrobacterium sp. SORGH_AS 787 TaxID=3041775 RepID=UPI002781760C|nr:iron(III) transport system ATP-binding protein [Rhizobium sp. SORGH_AS_0787]